MKKLMIGIMSIAFVLGAGTFALAKTDQSVEGTVNFKEMLPFMKEMHPNFSDDELQQMYNACHGTDGAETPEVQATKNINKF
ncbi:MAG: hypothetical protein ACQEXB_08575 [Bacillota bacterium]